MPEAAMPRNPGDCLPVALLKTTNVLILEHQQHCLTPRPCHASGSRPEECTIRLGLFKRSADSGGWQCRDSHGTQTGQPFAPGAVSHHSHTHLGAREALLWCPTSPLRRVQGQKSKSQARISPGWIGQLSRPEADMTRNPGDCLPVALLETTNVLIIEH